MKYCKLCNRDFTPGAWAVHAQMHVRRGELRKIEVVRVERSGISAPYTHGWRYEVVK